MALVLFVLILCLTVFKLRIHDYLCLDLFSSCSVKLSLPVIGAGVII